MCWVRKNTVSDAAFEDVQVDIQNNPWSTVNDIVSRTQWSRGTVVSVINLLREDRAVSRCRSYNGGFAYRANDILK
jgi:hypothetical protein